MRSMRPTGSSTRWPPQADRLLGLDMVPVTGDATIGGGAASCNSGLTNQSICANARTKAGADRWCDSAAQYNLMNVFDF